MMTSDLKERDHASIISLNEKKKIDESGKKMKKERKGNWQEKQTEQTGRPNNNPKPSINSKQPPDNTLHFTLTLQHQGQGHHPACQRIKVKRSNGKGILTLYYSQCLRNFYTHCSWQTVGNVVNFRAVN